MSYPYPQNRHLDRKEKGDQPYKDAKEALNENEAEIEQEASMPHGEEANKSIADKEHEAEERFEEIGADVAGEHEESSR